MRTWGLKLRIFLVVTLMFALLSALIAAVMYLLGVTSPVFYVGMAAAVMGIQYLLGPSIVDFIMNVEYVSERENPRLYSIVARVSAKAGIPMPRVGISHISIPNAFAYGRSMRDARVCVTQPLLELLSADELEAVIAHEIGHIKHRDMIIMTVLSVIPLICYYIYLSMIFSYGSRERGATSLLIALGALVMYYVAELMILYVSRTREYYADARSVELTGRPHVMASALYKLACYNVKRKERFSEEEIKKLECIKAFLAVEPFYRVPKEIQVLMEADVNKDGRIDMYELLQLKERAKGFLGLKSLIKEAFSTHPNILKRIIKLADYAL